MILTLWVHIPNVGLGETVRRMRHITEAPCYSRCQHVKELSQLKSTRPNLNPLRMYGSFLIWILIKRVAIHLVTVVFLFVNLCVNCWTMVNLCVNCWTMVNLCVNCWTMVNLCVNCWTMVNLCVNCWTMVNLCVNCWTMVKQNFFMGTANYCLYSGQHMYFWRCGRVSLLIMQVNCG
jgi:hypothetical protein